MRPAVEKLYMELLAELRKDLPEDYNPIRDIAMSTWGAISKAIENAERKPEQVRQAIEIVQSGFGPKGLIALGIAATHEPALWPKGLWQHLDDIDRRLRDSSTKPGLSEVGMIVYTLIWSYHMPLKECP